MSFEPDDLYDELDELTARYNTLPRLARAGQMLLHPRPMSLCRELGLDDELINVCLTEGWLSFDPRDVEYLTQGQMAELQCVGRALRLGRERARVLLDQLEPPFQYDFDKVFCDVAQMRWRSIDDTARMLVGIQAPHWAYELASAALTNRGAARARYFYVQQGDVEGALGLRCWDRAIEAALAELGARHIPQDDPL